MRANDAWPFICPVCTRGLQRDGGTMRCPQGHSFDIARQGYVHLLTGGDVERGITGDTRDMLHARRRFLDAGHFAPLLDVLTEEVEAVLSGPVSHRVQQKEAGVAGACVVEVGCGEGFYIGNVAGPDASRGSSTAGVRYIGLDVSKDAVRLAAGKYKGVRFAVANARRRLYVASGVVDVLLSIFAPRNGAEFRRVLADDGALIVALPGPSHMQHVRDAYGLLDMEEAKEDRVVEQFGDEFTLTARHVVEYPLTLSPADVRRYIAMGPNARHTHPESLRIPADVDTVASFIVLRFQKGKGGGMGRCGKTPGTRH